MSEWWAETFRVWVLNPNLLEVMRPIAAELMVATGLPKAHNLDWKDILANANPKWHAAVTNHEKKSIKSVGHKMRHTRLTNEAKERDEESNRITT